MNTEPSIHTEKAMCRCGIKLASACKEEWGPECDLGNNPKFARAVPYDAPKHVDYRSICLKHGIQVHQVRESCFSEQASADEQDKWFSSAPSDSIYAEKAVSVPLASTEDEAYRLAYIHFNLAR